jgi:hypothetical protein
MPRPKANIDWEKVGQLVAAGCDGVQVAAYFGIHPNTLYLACEEEYKISFSDFLQEKRSKGDAMILASQFEAAIRDKDRTMLIWLGKQRLGQREKQDTDITSGGKVIHVTLPTPPNE